MPTIEVFADITCPFTHVGLKQVVEHVAELPEPPDVVVRSWPLEWVNGAPLAVDAVLTKAAALTDQLGVDDFVGLRADRWPETTIPALNLASAAYQRTAGTGLAISLALRSALFEHGLDIADTQVLASIAADHGLAPPGREPVSAITADYERGRRLGVQGSPHFFVGADGFFCPALDLGHDDDGHLTARFDRDQLAAFLARLGA